MLMHRIRKAPAHRGQTLTEFALAAPLFTMVLIGIVVLGLVVFYQQQVANAAREAARYAAIHSATARCPTVSNLPPAPALLPVPNSFWECDTPADRWPNMTGAARSKLFAMSAQAVQVTACWSGYWVKDTNGNFPPDGYDQVAIDSSGNANDFRECSVEVYGWLPGQDPGTVVSAVQVINPRTSKNSAGQQVRVDCTRQFPLTTASDDMASSYAASAGASANQVTVLACFSWEPPLAGFLLIPRVHNVVGVVTEAMEYQQ
jgi:hypothetical protein